MNNNNCTTCSHYNAAWDMCECELDVECEDMCCTKWEGRTIEENKKPRIAEILGVEVGERFSLMGFQPYYVEFWIKSDGTFETNPPCTPNSSVALLRAVEQPCFVIHKPRWTKRDVEDAKALKRLIADAHHVWRGDGLNDTPLLYDEYEDQMWILNDCFAALPPRTNITLDEIIGGAE